MTKLKDAMKNPHSILHQHVFIKTLMRSVLTGAGLIILLMLIGMLGYQYYENMSWVDSYVNAAMILSGMGPMGDLKTTGGKIFAGSYALFSGLVFIMIIGLVFAPVAHRFFKKIHLDDDNVDNNSISIKNKKY